MAEEGEDKLEARGAVISESTPGEFAVFLNQKNAINPCPVCGVEDWLGEAKDGAKEMQPVYLLSSAKARLALPVAAVAYILTCNNCGFIRFHNRAMVRPDAK